MYRPLIPLLVSYLTGLLIGFYLPIPRFILLPGILLALIFFIATIIIRAQRLSHILAIILFALIGILYLQSILSPYLSSSHISHYVTGKKVVLEGVISKSPELFTDKTRLHIETEKIIEHNKITNINGILLLTIKKNFILLTTVTGYVSPLSCAFPETLITREGSTTIDTWPLRIYWLLLLCTT